MTPADRKRALHLYELALMLVEARGVTVTLGVTTFKEYRTAALTIHYLPRWGRLDIWHRRKVLTIDRGEGSPKVAHYARGKDWEHELEMAAKLPPKR